MADSTPEKAPRKTTRRPASKGPTKAQALKALGLTKEDLDYIKDRNSPPNVGEASATLHPGSGFGDNSPQQVIETHQRPESQAVALPATEEPIWYMRNLRQMDVGFRLSRQEATGQKRTNLKPRGQRGDIVKLEPGDLKDAELQTQVSYGLVEVIPEGEALEAIRKQYTNYQNTVPAHIAMLRNPKGEEYTQVNPVTMASDDEAYGIKVADLDPGLMQGKLSDKEIKRSGGFAQNAQQTPTGGNPSIISDGFMAQPQQGLGNNGDNEKAAEVDALARSKAFEGPGAGVGEVTVKVMPTQRT
jgi:hypothetical protein